MYRILIVTATVLIFVQSAVGAAISTEPEIRTERVQFSKGATSAAIKGQVKGYSNVDSLVRAGAARRSPSR
jgi:uncharacterized membrane protein AbrB (regulator of aidB expression)